jgi:hypothetical protein
MSKTNRVSRNKYVSRKEKNGPKRNKRIRMIVKTIENGGETEVGVNPIKINFV